MRTSTGRKRGCRSLVSGIFGTVRRDAQTNQASSSTLDGLPESRQSSSQIGGWVGVSLVHLKSCCGWIGFTGYTGTVFHTYQPALVKPHYGAFAIPNVQVGWRYTRLCPKPATMTDNLAAVARNVRQAFAHSVRQFRCFVHNYFG